MFFKDRVYVTSEYIYDSDMSLEEFLEKIQQFKQNRNASDDCIHIVPNVEGDCGIIEIVLYRNKTEQEIEQEKKTQELYKQRLAENEKIQLKALVHKYRNELPEILDDKNPI